MSWLLRLWSRFTSWRREIEEPFDCWDSDYLASTPRVDSDFGCPDTQPTAPGALDSDLSRIE